MDDSLSSRLALREPRETSGSSSANAFDFQKDWAICKILELHTKEEDYLVLLDYHEDIIVLDSESDPINGDFFQVKKKNNGNWTLGQLTSQKKNSAGKPLPSILEKLFSSRQLLSEGVRNLTFSSNQPISAKLRGAKKNLVVESIRFDELSPELKEKIHYCIEGDSCQVCDWEGLKTISVI